MKSFKNSIIVWLVVAPVPIKLNVSPYEVMSEMNPTLFLK